VDRRQRARSASARPAVKVGVAMSAPSDRLATCRAAQRRPSASGRIAELDEALPEESCRSSTWPSPWPMSGHLTSYPSDRTCDECQLRRRVEVAR
jgi:hypothetical protein